MEDEKVEEVVFENVDVDNVINFETVDTKNDNKKLLFLISAISIIVLFIIVLLFIIFFNSPKKVITEKKVGGEVSISYTDKTSTLNVVNITPVEDGTAIKDLTGDNYFEFSVDTKVKGAKEVTYEISINKNEDKCTIKDEDIKIYLEKENSGSYARVFGPAKFSGINKKSKIGTPKGNMILTTVTNKKSITENYRLKIWLSSRVSSEAVNQNYSVDIILTGNAE